MRGNPEQYRRHLDSVSGVTELWHDSISTIAAQESNTL